MTAMKGGGERGGRQREMKGDEGGDREERGDGGDRER